MPPSHSASALEPIADPDGEFLWVPVAVAETQADAVAFAQRYWPERPCYQPYMVERFTLTTYEDADDDGKATLDEYGGDHVAAPCGEDEGQAYWPIRCYPEAVGDAR